MSAFTFCMVYKNDPKSTSVEMVVLAEDHQEVCKKLAEKGESLFESYLCHGLDSFSAMKKLIPELETWEEDTEQACEAVKKYSLECSKDECKAEKFLDLFTSGVWIPKRGVFTKHMVMNVTDVVL